MSKIGQLLVHLHGKKRVSLASLTVQRESLRQKLQQLSQQVEGVNAESYTHKTIHRIDQQIQRVREKILGHKKMQNQEHDAQEKEKEIEKLSRELE